MDPQERNIEVAILQLQIQCISLLLKFLKMSLTGKSFSEALIFASTNPQYDKKLFIELQVQYMKIATQHVLSFQFSCTVVIR